MCIVASRSPVCAQYRTQVPTEVPIVPAGRAGIGVARLTHRAAYAASEADAARENERLATAHFAAGLGERRERRSLELERRTTE